MTDSDRDPDTQLPRALTLGDVFNSIRLAPQDIARLLGDWASQYRGGTHDALGNALADHARMVSDPQTYGWKPDDRRAGAPAVPPVEQRASYGAQAPSQKPLEKPQPTTTPDAPQSAPDAVQGAPARPQPFAPPVPPDADPAGKAGALWHETPEAP